MKPVYLFGKKALEDAINNHLEFEMVYLTINQQQLVKLLKSNNILYQIVNANFFNNLTNVKKTQDVAFVLKQTNHPIDLKVLLEQLSKKDKSLILMLDEIQDLGNLGAILRTADAFNVDAVIYKSNNQANPFNEIVIKTSTNAVSYLTLCEVTNLNQAIEKLKNNGFWIYASCLDNDSTNYHNQSYANKTVLVVGNEHKGVSQLVLKNSDVKIHIPQFGSVQSLNVSVATGILLADYRTKHSL